MGLRGWNGVADKARIGIGDLGTDFRTMIAARAVQLYGNSFRSTLTIFLAGS